jgi:hypothetical protein
MGKAQERKKEKEKGNEEALEGAGEGERLVVIPSFSLRTLSLSSSWSHSLQPNF